MDESNNVHHPAWPISSEGVSFLGQVFGKVMWRGGIGGVNGEPSAEERKESLMIVMK